MNTDSTDGPVFDKLYKEWSTTLLAYKEELQTLDNVIGQMQSSVNDLHFQQEVKQLCTRIVLQKNVLGVLSEEVIQLRKKYAGRDEKNVVPLADLVENNRFRDKIRKIEQSIFMLKYQVNKLLSIAS